MGNFVQEFKEFALKGNVVDMAVGVIIGGAFGKIVSSLVNDIIMPPIGVLTGGVDFKDLKTVLVDATEEAEAVTLNWGMFVQNIIDFLIIAISIFCIIKMMTKLSKKKEEPAPAPAEPEPTKEEVLLTEIRDLLKK
jgi:large conductance mechanosensitive channel